MGGQSGDRPSGPGESAVLVFGDGEPVRREDSGENGPTMTEAGWEETPLFVTTTFTLPGTSSHGTWALICEPFANSIGAGVVVDPFTNCTVTPPSEVESGIVSAAAVFDASAVPKMVISDPGVTGTPF